jgi:hypothetical protein
VIDDFVRGHGTTLGEGTEAQSAIPCLSKSSERIPLPDQTESKATLPPRWVVRSFWSVHRGLFRLSGGRFGLRSPKGNRYGMMRLTTIGRRSGQERSVILGYFDDGPNLVTMAMNGWDSPEPGCGSTSRPIQRQSSICRGAGRR